MIYITGDVHGGVDVRKLLDKDFQKKVTTEDYLIICGDFGFIWNYKKEKRKEKKWLEWFNSQKYTTLFVDGNHECFPRLNAYPEKEWNGGKIHVIRDKVYHLKRGQVFTIEGNTIFTMGGAASHDRGPAAGDTKAVIGKYWWPEEIPSKEEMEEGLKNLEKVNNKVDYIVTHCLSTKDQYTLKKDAFASDALTEYHQYLHDHVQYMHWYGGHYHMSVDLEKNVTEVFNRILELGETVAASKPIIGSPVYKKGDKVCFFSEGKCTSGTVSGIYPWGKLKVKDQPVYDMLLEDKVTEAKYIKEDDILGYSCI